MSNLSHKKIGVLYVDDEVNNLTSFKAVFRREYQVFVADNAQDGLRLIEENPHIQLAISDQRMPETTGIDFLAQLKETKPEIIRILLTGYADIEAVIDAINKGEVYRYLSKPWDEENLRQIMRGALEVFKLRHDNQELMLKLKEANEKLEFLLRQKLIS